MSKPFYVVFSGNICSGKDTVIDEIKLGRRFESLNIPLTFLREAVNNDPDVLRNYYEDQERMTFPFEMATLGSRLVLYGNLVKLQGIVFGNRNVIEARHIFVEHGSDNGLLNGMQIGMYDLLLRTGIDQGLLVSPDLVFFMDVQDPEILFRRKETRSDKGEENLKLNYLQELVGYYNRFRENFESIYKQWRLPVPKLFVLDASGDISEMPKLAKECERIILREYRKE